MTNDKRLGGGRLEGKVVMIAGGGTGIGEAAALMFAREGARVVIGDIRADAAAVVAASVTAAGGEALGCTMNVRDEASVEAAFGELRARFGRLDILFNCAGGSIPTDAPITDVDMDVWSKTMELDAKGTMLTCRHAIRLMLESGAGGSVVNMSSGAALRGSGKAHIYAAAKGAIVSFTRVLAGTYAKDGVRANAICAGRINTQRIRDTYGIPGQPGKSQDAMQVDEQIKTYPFWFGEPEDIAAIALVLASDESRMITGAAIPADGGRSAY
jgi:NAD(P)-dependent dehydrogenase (short-subunit alcohol dehydrogenase family)